MTINPYVTPEYVGESDPAAAAVIEAASPKGRKTNWFTMTGALIGLAIGFATATYPTGEFVSDYESGRAMGRVLGHAIVCMMLCGFSTWLLWLLCTRPLRGLMVVGVVGLLAGLLVVSRVSGRISESVPHDLPAEDLSRHDEPGRAKASDGRFSWQPPGEWRRIDVNENLHGFVGPINGGHATNISVESFPHRGLFRVDEVQRATLQATPADANVLDSGTITVDGKKGFFFVADRSASGRVSRTAKYVLPGRHHVYNISATWSEPLPKEIEQKIKAMVASVQID